MEPFKLERHFSKYEFQATYMASSSDAESMSLDDLLKLDAPLRSSLMNTWLGYSESNGILELREAIAKTYMTITSEQVLTHTGAEEPIFNFFHSCLHQSDHVIVHFPCYQSFYSVPQSLGCEVSLWKASFENQWRLDLNELKKLIRPSTRAVILNAPHNPTGWVISVEDQKNLIDILRAQNIYLFSDEVYREIELDSKDRVPAACDLYENAISLGVLSKAYGLAGLRLGWIASRNADVISKMAAQKDYTTICNPILSEKIGTTAVLNREFIIGRNRALVQTNWRVAESFFERQKKYFDVIAPRGGTMIFPRAKPNFELKKFIKDILEKKGVMIVGGEHFDMPENYFRLGLGRKNFPEVLALIEQHIAEFTSSPKS